MYSVAELEQISAKILEALTAAKDKAEQEVAAKTPISAPKKKTTSARASEEVSSHGTHNAFCIEVLT